MLYVGPITVTVIAENFQLLTLQGMPFNTLIIYCKSTLKITVIIPNKKIKYRY